MRGISSIYQTDSMVDASTAAATAVEGHIIDVIEVQQMLLENELYASAEMYVRLRVEMCCGALGKEAAVQLSMATEKLSPIYIKFDQLMFKLMIFTEPDNHLVG